MKQETVDKSGMKSKLNVKQQKGGGISNFSVIKNLELTITTLSLGLCPRYSIHHLHNNAIEFDDCLLQEMIFSDKLCLSVRKQSASARRVVSRLLQPPYVRVNKSQTN